MGLFDKVFEKKNCDICGEKIGLLGNRKLEDGNLCKNCAAKLSPWFSERRKSTVDQIRDQLAYREANRGAVAAFNETRSIGNHTRLLLDEGNRKFMVTSARNLSEANPDVLDFSQATGCNLEVKESRSEMKTKDKEGKSVSYNPPRYEYSYNFYVTIRVNHPWFDEIRFPLNAGAVRTGEHQMGTGVGSSWTIQRSTFSMQDRGLREYEDYIRMGEEIRQAVEQQMRQGERAEGAPQAGYSQAQAETQAQAYGQQAAAPGEYGAAQAGYSQQPYGTPQQAAVPAGSVHMQKVTCPWCGGSVAAGKECELCGGPLG